MLWPEFDLIQSKEKLDSIFSLQMQIHLVRKTFLYNTVDDQWTG